MIDYDTKLSLKQIRLLCEDYDKGYRTYPESYQEGWSVYTHILESLGYYDDKEWDYGEQI